MLKNVVIQKLTESGKAIDLFYALRKHRAGDDIFRPVTLLSHGTILLSVVAVAALLSCPALA